MSGTTYGTSVTHDPLCPVNQYRGFPDPTGLAAAAACRCDLITKVRQDEREQTWKRAADAVYETTDGLPALLIHWAIDPESQPHEMGWRCYKTGTVEVCQRCGENWPCTASQEKQ